MYSPEQILAAIRELKPQLNLLLGTEAASIQQKITPLIEKLVAGQTDGQDLLRLLAEYPSVTALLQQMLDKQIQTDEFNVSETLPYLPKDNKGGQSVLTNSDKLKSSTDETDDDFAEFEDLLVDKSPYEDLPGEPSTAIAGKKYICPVPECPQEWFRVGLRTPPLCEEHGVVMVPATDKD